MKNIYVWVSVQILITGAVMMAVSFLPEILRDFFGDWKCEGSKWISADKDINSYRDGCLYFDFDHNPQWHWGYRHWIWFFMGIAYFLLNLIRVITRINVDNSPNK